MAEKNDDSICAKSQTTPEQHRKIEIFVTELNKLSPRHRHLFTTRHEILGRYGVLCLV